jgi:hypothetical protein
VDAVPAPDIREPRRPGAVTMWRYEDKTATPAVAPPSQAAVEAILDVAEPRLGHPIEAYDAAVRLSSLGVDDLIALLVHPPPPPDNEMGRWLTATDPAWWVKCVQVWACLGLLHHGSDEAWAGSARRQVLVDIAWGIEDWTTEAALFALVAAAWVDPAVRTDVAGLVADRLADLAEVSQSRAVTIAWSVATLALRTPGLSEDARDLARAIVVVNSPDEEGPSTTPSPPATASWASATPMPSAAATAMPSPHAAATPTPRAVQAPGATPAATAKPTRRTTAIQSHRAKGKADATPTPTPSTPTPSTPATPPPRPAGGPPLSTEDGAGPGGARHRRRWFGPKR